MRASCAAFFSAATEQGQGHRRLDVAIAIDRRRDGPNDPFDDLITLPTTTQVYKPTRDPEAQSLDVTIRLTLES